MTENIMVAIQRELKAPKGQYNSHGKYKYRSCEDIVEGAKPILAEHGCYLVLIDSLESHGNRVFVKAMASIIGPDNNAIASTTAYAEHATVQKGMQIAQISGSTSSYARKYALNGLFAIDDTKDNDTDENRREQESKARKAKEESKKAKEELLASIPEDLSLYFYDIAGVAKDRREAAGELITDKGGVWLAGTLYSSPAKIDKLAKYWVTEDDAADREEHYMGGN